MARAGTAERRRFYSKETMDIKPERNLDQILAKNPELVPLTKVANVTPNNDTIWKYWAKRIGVVELIMKCNSVTPAGEKVEFNEVHPLLMA